MENQFGLTLWKYFGNEDKIDKRLRQKNDICNFLGYAARFNVFADLNRKKILHAGEKSVKFWLKKKECCIFEFWLIFN